MPARCDAACPRRGLVRVSDRPGGPVAASVSPIWGDCSGRRPCRDTRLGARRRQHAVGSSACLGRSGAAFQPQPPLGGQGTNSVAPCAARREPSPCAASAAAPRRSVARNCAQCAHRLAASGGSHCSAAAAAARQPISGLVSALWKLWSPPSNAAPPTPPCAGHNAATRRPRRAGPGDRCRACSGGPGRGSARRRHAPAAGQTVWPQAQARARPRQRAHCRSHVHDVGRLCVATARGPGRASSRL